MDLNSADGGNKVDPELKDFIVNEQMKAQIREQIRKLNNICFPQCVEKPTTKLEPKQETCIQNCVGRYLDTNGLVATRLARRTNVSSDSFA